MFQHLFQPSVFPNQFERRLWSYAFNGFEVVAAEENAEVDELYSNTHMNGKSK